MCKKLPISYEVDVFVCGSGPSGIAAALMGIRETRHFKGVYTITEEDILSARQFPDWIVRDAHFNFDIHNLDGARLDKDEVQHRFTQKSGCTISYGCLIPEKLDGIILAGRCISGTHKAHSNYRVMPICVGIGEGRVMRQRYRQRTKFVRET